MLPGDALHDGRMAVGLTKRKLTFRGRKGVEVGDVDVRNVAVGRCGRWSRTRVGVRCMPMSTEDVGVAPDSGDPVGADAGVSAVTSASEGCTTTRVGGPSALLLVCLVLILLASRPKPGPISP